METILTILVVGTLNAVCFFIGAKVGQKVVKGEPIELPSVDPMKAYREKQDRKQAEKEADKISTILQNIEAYDGTSMGQKDVM
ncbi:MAG: hypothetical protein U0K91_07220 [Acutalibacteraceae bacterium]|nr:hypothetical protein [Acutalibacteraceae bacterium]